MTEDIAYDPYAPRTTGGAKTETVPVNSELTPDEIKALKFHHYAAISDQQAKVAEQQAEYKRLRKLAKADGIILSDIDFMMKCAEIEDETILTDRAKREAEIMAWFALPVQFQAEMFEAPAREPGEDRARREGWAAGYAGKNDEPPYDANSPMGRAWSEEWRKAQDKRLSDWQSAMEKKQIERDELIKGSDEDEDPFEEAA